MNKGEAMNLQDIAGCVVFLAIMVIAFMAYKSTTSYTRKQA